MQPLQPIDLEKVAQLEPQVLDVLREHGPSCECWITTQIFGFEYCSDDYFQVFPRVLLAVDNLRRRGEVLCTEDPEEPLRLPNQHLGARA